MYGIYLACIGLVFALLGSCRHLPTRSHAPPATAPLTHFYDYQLVSSATQQPISFEQLVHELASSDVIFVGEWHSHSASHYLQMQLLAALYQHHPQLMLSMEQFARLSCLSCSRALPKQNSRPPTKTAKGQSFS